ncbi:MAG: endonuclease/exonuclease/phosphatase family protein [Bacteroidales bacterium]|nr:endonuclease/exonuclease/phosphatase family protein [Bacteroidales bacterium]MDP2235857.1 endonuclease/exonuclease/phosphatase family protein [Bacteroidales bacterium]
MKYLFWALALVFASLSVRSQSIGYPALGTEKTLEVMTWNIEWFPKNGQSTLDYVTAIINDLDVDLIAFQEIGDTVAFKQMLINLEGYSGFFKSARFGGLVYVYKKNTIHINQIYEIYTGSSFRSPFPRAPVVIDFNFRNQNYIVINNHLKCCGDGFMNISNPNDEETRRFIAVNLLKEYVDVNFPDKNVMIVGDLNDVIEDAYAHNVFRNILDDKDNYLFADLGIANGNSANWAYPSWPSHLDHIIITNELFDAFDNDTSEIRVVKIDEYLAGGWQEYDQHVSDHRPVAIKLMPDQSLGVQDFDVAMHPFSNYPNPFSEETSLSFPLLNVDAEVLIGNMFGQIVFKQQVNQGQTSLKWNPQRLPEGVYFANLIVNGRIVAFSKLVFVAQ